MIFIIYLHVFVAFMVYCVVQLIDEFILIQSDLFYIDKALSELKENQKILKRKISDKEFIN